MAGWTLLGLGAGASAGVVIAGAAVVGALGYFVILPQFRDAPAPDSAPAALVAPTSDSAPAIAADAPPPAAAEIAPPKFDVVRVDPQGAALVAGIGDPGKTVEVLLDGVILSSAQAGGDGRFVAMFDIVPSAQPRSLQLSMQVEDVALLSDETILVAPFDAPEAVAEADAPEAAPEPATAPPLVVASRDGVQVLQAAPAPEAPVATAALDDSPADAATTAPAAPRLNVTIDAISYTAEGAVELSGRGTVAHFARLYLDNSVLRTAPVGSDGKWRMTLDGIEAGIYTLRVDELDAEGAVQSRFETPFKREDPALLAAAQEALRPPPAVEAQENPAMPAPVAETPTEAAPVAETVAEAAPETALETVVEAPENATETVAALAPAPRPAPAPTPAPAAPPAPAPVAAPVATPAQPRPTTGRAQVITVQPGFTLWGIARDMMGEGEMYVQVFEANRDQIRNPDLIYPGQVFTLPVTGD